MKTVLLENLDIFHEKVAEQSKSLQLHFYEKYLIVGRPLMTERALAAMMYTHRLGLSMFSPNRELRGRRPDSAPLIGMILSPPIYLRSQVLLLLKCKRRYPLVNSLGCENSFFHQKILQKLEESKLEDVLYCASENEMSEWIDWFEEEDKAGSFTNQLLAYWPVSSGEGSI